MSIEMKIDVNSGTTVDDLQGSIVVRGYFKNLGNDPQRVTDNDVQYSLQAPYGNVEIRDASPRFPLPVPVLPPFGRVDFQHELVAYANTYQLDPNAVYRLTATLPGVDQDASLFRFRQNYAGATAGDPAAS